MMIVRIKKFLKNKGKFITYLFFICLAFLIYRSLEDFSKVDAIISKTMKFFNCYYLFNDKSKCRKL